MGNLMYYEWINLEAFEIWHQNFKTNHGYPIPSVNSSTAIIDQNAQWTTDYTTPIEIGNKIIAFVDDDLAEGLTLSTIDPTQKPEFLK
jgi:hypothetical protein